MELELGIEEWETALLRLGPQLGESEWLSFREEGEPEDEDDAFEIRSSFEDVAAPYRLGQLSVDYPESMHGDGASVEVFLLPGGSAVGLPFATWDNEETGFIIAKATLPEILTQTRRIIANLLDEDANTEWIEELPEEPEGNYVVREGMKELLANWEVRSSSD